MILAQRPGTSVWLQLLAIAIGGWLLTVVAEHVDQRHRERAAWQQTEAQLRKAAQRMEKNLKEIEQINLDFAAALPADFRLDEARLHELADKLVNAHPQVLNITLSRQFEVVFVHPPTGNEAVLGMNYTNRPSNMHGIERALARRGSVLTGPIILVQNNRPALVSRTPIYFAATAPGQANGFQGLVSSVIDLDGMLADAGLLSPPFALAIRGRDGSGARGETFFGDPALFQQPHIGLDLNVPGGQWRLAATPPPPAAAPLHAWLIRGGVLLPALLLAAWILLRRPAKTLPRIARLANGRIGLRGFMLGTLTLILLPIVAISAWLAYLNTEQSAGRFANRLADALGKDVHDRIATFFEIPKRIVAFNVEQARAGLLGETQRDQTARALLLQIRQQPSLTFISVGFADGEYYAGSRPPGGSDTGLRLLQARIAEQRRLHIYRVDDAARQTALVETPDTTFDARTRPWFVKARDSGRMAWYPAYPYSINDNGGAYDGMGIGMSAPLYDPAGEFIGVTAADVALTQLSGLLREWSKESGGVAFLTESNGQLLASSTAQALYHAHGDSIERIAPAHSDNPLLRAADSARRAAGQADGNAFLRVDGIRYLFNWRSYQLELGPPLSIGVILPQSHFDTLVSDTLENMFYLGLAVLLFSLLLSLLATDWISRPLIRLSQAASRMAAGNWQAAGQESSPVREVAALFTAIDDMALQLQRHTASLERQAADLRSGNERLQSEIGERMKSEQRIQALYADLEATNRTLRQAKEAAETASKAKSAFLANMSHELRTPMHGIMGMISLVRGRVAEPKLRGQLDRAMEAANRLLLILNDILDISKIEADRLSLEAGTFQLAPVLDNVLGLIAPKAAEKQLALRREPLPAELAGSFIGDALRLGQILINLAGNAVKFTEQGEIGIAASLVEESADQVRLRFTVSDTGIGIAAGESERLFDAFEQADNSITRKFGGTGLGLAICKKLVRMMDGEIGVDSQPGQGSRFWFTVRLARALAGTPR